jgi:hypothetical protein
MTAEFSELANDPGECVLIGSFVSDRQVYFNANSLSEVRQGVLSSTPLLFFLAVSEILRLRCAASAVSSRLQP